MVRALVAFVLMVLSGAGVFGVACAEANLPPEDDDSVRLPDRIGVDSNVAFDAGDEASDAADAADAAPSSYGVFVSSAPTVANFGGTAGADTVCQELAMAQGLSRKWVAWLSTKDGVSAIDRVTSPGPWQLATGELVASSKVDLASGTLKHAIDQDEKKVPVVGEHVWTGSGPDGAYLTNDCDSWTTGSQGRVGSTSSVDATWTSAAVDDCTNARRLYCFEN